MYSKYLSVSSYICVGCQDVTDKIAPVSPLGHGENIRKPLKLRCVVVEVARGDGQTGRRHHRGAAAVSRSEREPQLGSDLPVQRRCGADDASLRVHRKRGMSGQARMQYPLHTCFRMVRPDTLRCYGNPNSSHPSFQKLIINHKLI